MTKRNPSSALNSMIIIFLISSFLILTNPQSSEASARKKSQSRNIVFVSAEYPINAVGLSAGGLTYDGKTLWVSVQDMGRDGLFRYSLKGDQVD